MSIQSTAGGVAAYLRKTTPRQEDSIQAQRERVAICAAQHGPALTIDVEYADEGISGGVIEDRPGFQKLLAAVRAGKVKIIIVDEFSRLVRAHPIDTISDVIRPLRDAGVILLTVKDGRVEWDTLAGLIMMAIKSGQAFDEVKTLAYRILSRAMSAVEQGRRRGGAAPHGYALKREEGKKGSWLVLNPETEPVVKLAFQRVLAGDPASAIVERLNRLGYPAPKGGLWTTPVLGKLLRNPVYAGHLTWGRKPSGDHYRLVDGVLLPTAETVKHPHPQTFIVVANTHPPIVSQAEFDLAQTLLAKRSNFRGKAVERDGFALSGMLTCGNCHRTLFARRDRKGKVTYRCSPRDNSRQVVCRCYGVSEELVIRSIAYSLRSAFSDRERLEAAKARAMKELNADRDPKEMGRVRAALAAKEKELATARRRMLMCSDEVAKMLEGELVAMTAERDRLADEVRRREVDIDLSGFDEMAEAADAILERLEDAMAAEDPGMIRELLTPLVRRVEVEWSVRPAGKRCRYGLAGGTIVMNTTVEASKTRGLQDCIPVSIPLLCACA